MSRTVQMRSFEPATMNMSVEVQVDPTDNVDAVITQVKRKVKTELDLEANILKKERMDSQDDPMEKSL